MSLKPEASVMSGLAVAGVVYAIHSNFTPTMADIQGLPTGNKDLDKAERQATWLSVGVVSGVSLLAKDPTIFVIGSAMTLAMAIFTRNAVWTDTKNTISDLVPGQSMSAASANELSSGPEAPVDYTMFPQSEFVS